MSRESLTLQQLHAERQRIQEAVDELDQEKSSLEEQLSHIRQQTSQESQLVLTHKRPNPRPPREQHSTARHSLFHFDAQNNKKKKDIFMAWHTYWVPSRQTDVCFLGLVLFYLS